MATPRACESGRGKGALRLMHQVQRASRILMIAVAASVALVVPGASGQVAEPAVPLVRLPFPQDDGSLTPYTFELGYSLMALVYDTLMWRDEQGVPQPWLAQSVEQSVDARQVTLRLADGVRWHDGVPLSAADVAFSFEYFADRPHPRFTPQLSAIETIEVVDASTVEIGLAHPSLGFPDLPLSDLPILPSHLWRDLPPDQAAPEGLPVGSGPYRLSDYRVGQAYRFEANLDYFQGPPAVSVIEVPIITDAEATLAAFERREVDMIPVSLPEAAATRLERSGAEIMGGPSYLGTILVLNLREPPFDRLELRQVVARSLDLRRLAPDDAEPADRGYLHPRSAWSSTERLHTYDPGAARDQVTGSGLSTLELVTPANDPVKVEAAREVGRALDRVGLDVGVRTLGVEDFAAAVGGDGSAPTFQMAISSSPALASYDPSLLQGQFGAKADGSPSSLSGYRSEAFDAAAQRLVVSADRDSRQRAVDDALRLLSADLPVVPLFFSSGRFAFRPAVYDGWVYIEGSGILDKRSFVQSSPSPAPSSDDGDSPSSGTSGNLPFGALALGLLAVVVAIGGADLVRRRR